MDRLYWLADGPMNLFKCIISCDIFTCNKLICLGLKKIKM